MTHRLALLQNRLCQRGPKSQYRRASIVNGTVIMGISNQASAYNPATTNLKTLTTAIKAPNRTKNTNATGTPAVSSDDNHCSWPAEKTAATQSGNEHGNHLT